MKKRLLSAVMCGFIALQTVPVSADDAVSADLAVEGEIADETSDGSSSSGVSGSDEVSELIVYTKKLFKIGSEYDEFHYSYSKDEDSGETVYNLFWKNTETSSTVRTYIDGNKYIHQYDISDENENSGLGALTSEEAKAAADSFLSLVIPEEYRENVRFNKVKNASAFRSHNVSYQYTVNDIPVEDAYFYVYVSKITGKVIYYAAPLSCPFNYDYPTPENIISAEEAHDNYREYCTFGFEYPGYFDSKEKMYIAFPCFFVRDITSYKVDAFTGESIAYGYEGSFGGSGGASSASYDLAEETADEKEEDYKLTEAEISAMEEKEELLTSEEALALLEREVQIKDKTNMYSNLWKESTGEYVWLIHIDNDNTDISVYVDASTGEITYYCDANSVLYLKKGEEKPSLDYDKMLETAERILNTFSVGKADEVKLEYNAYEDDETGAYSYEFNYIRVVNGIEYRDNYINISFDTYSSFDYYNCTWHKNVNFADTEGAIDIDTGYDKMFETLPPVLTYVNTETGIGLAYVFNYYIDRVYLDKYGNRVNYKGNPYEEEEDFEGYIDIEGYKYEDIIKLLYNNGYYIDRDEFKPNEPMAIDDFAVFFKIRGTKTERGCEFSELEGKYYGENLTRYETAEILAGLVDKRLLDVPEIFDVSYYKDEIDENYKAAVALCYGLGYMKGDDKDCFNGETLLTNGEAAKILYNYLTNR
ncbi:MAG: PepSY domain-containing protein [Clostridiales bacterium]|nr:PepSY domain-containing protein [Clostridiales bacterium]